MARLFAVFSVLAALCAAVPVNPDSSHAGLDTSDTSISTTATTTTRSRTASSSPKSSITTSATASVSPSAAASSTSSASSASGAAYTGLPQPFDVALGANFTSSTCPALFNKIITDPQVVNCAAMSLLIQDSRSFYDTETSPIALSKTMDISCTVISSTCNELLQSYAAQVSSSNGCKTELNDDNSRVQQLFYGLLSYLPIYNAACLKVSSTNTSTSTNGNGYCLTAAVENSLDPADISLYGLPLGEGLSGSPSCSACTQQAMGIFADAARNLTSPLANNYVEAANAINAHCGANFVNSTFVPIPNSNQLSGAAILHHRSSWITAAVVAVSLSFFL